MINWASMNSIVISAVDETGRRVQEGTTRIDGAIDSAAPRTNGLIEWAGA